MSRNRPLHCVRLFLVVILMVSVAANGTQAVVLCTGRDGHVAVEVAGHHHCHGSDHHKTPGVHGRHHCEGDYCSNEAHYPDTVIEEHHTCCGPHEEMPLSPGLTNEPDVQKLPETKILSAGIVLSISDTTKQSLEVFILARAGPASTSFYNPLRSIILIV